MRPRTVRPGLVRPRLVRPRVVWRAACSVAAVAFAFACFTPARAATTFSRGFSIRASDGVVLQGTLTGASPIAARPTVVEFSPYGRNSGTLDPGPAYNFLLVQIRGTGDSNGTFDALGARTQQDVADVLGWACHQSWSDGNLALNGFSASAITVYNSLHLPLPCVRAAVLKSGTFSLYRDLLSPGGIGDAADGLGVLALIGAPALAQGRLAQDLPGLINAFYEGGLVHTDLDAWWHEREFRGDVNHVPTLMIDGFFDVESRGAFQAYQALKSNPSHLMVIGAHDGSPKGTDGGLGEARAWLDHYVRGVANGVDTHPAVQAWLSNGDRLAYLGGSFSRLDATDWPIPGTTWQPMYLRPDGGLGAPSGASAHQSYLDLPSFPPSSDPPNTAILGGDGLNALGQLVPASDQCSSSLGLRFTTAPLSAPLDTVGPLDLDVPVASVPATTDIWAVVCDVWPDGTSHPLTVGRLNTAYPKIDLSRSLVSGGAVVQPFGVYAAQSPGAVGQQRLYHVEFWPVGNHFAAGHRIQLLLTGVSGASRPAPALNTVLVGGPQGAVLRVPVVPAT